MEMVWSRGETGCVYRILYMAGKVLLSEVSEGLGTKLTKVRLDGFYEADLG